MLDILVAHLAHPRALGLYVGVSGISIGLGGGLGNFLGGWLYDLGKVYNFPLLPWLVFAAVGILTTWQLLLYFRRYPQTITS